MHKANYKFQKCDVQNGIINTYFNLDVAVYIVSNEDSTLGFGWDSLRSGFFDGFLLLKAAEKHSRQNIQVQVKLKSNKKAFS